MVPYIPTQGVYANYIYPFLDPETIQMKRRNYRYLSIVKILYEVHKSYVYHTNLK